MIPSVVLRVGRKVAEFAIRNAPKAMAIAGVGCVAIGTAMACDASLRVDAVIENHKDMMDKIKEAEEKYDDYTEEDAVKDKIQAYAITCKSLGVLYGPALTVELAGIALLIGAFDITQKRYMSAMAALASLDQSFQNYRSRVREAFGSDVAKALDSTPVNKLEEKVELPWETPEDRETVYIDESALDDDFFFIISEDTVDHEHWLSTDNPNRMEFLYNYNAIVSQLETLKMSLSTHARNHLFINDIIRLLGLSETEIGHYYGYTDDPGDTIIYEITPFIYEFSDEDNSQFPLMIPITKEEVMEIERNDISFDRPYGYALRFRSAYTEDGRPRMIAKTAFAPKHALK